MTAEYNRRKYRQRTQGVKGARMPRINMAFDKDVYDYIRSQAKKEGVTMTLIVNEAVREKIESIGGNGNE